MTGGRSFSFPDDDDPPPPPPGGGSDDESILPLTDEDLALRFAARHVSTLRYAPQIGRWFIWNGSVWLGDERTAAFSLIRKLCREASRECNKPAMARAILSAKTAPGVERLARADQRLVILMNEWDVDPWLLNTPGGVVDLKTGKIRAHSSGDYMTKIARVAPGGDCPLFKAFLRRIFSEDGELIAYMRCLLGYSLTGVTREEEIYFWHGGGKNGKGVLMSIIEWIMNGYCVTSNEEAFMMSSGDRHPTELARFKGARVVLVSEIAANRRWNEPRLKQLTGGDTIAARFMRQDFFEFKPEFKPQISANHKPILTSVGVAMRRRLRLIPFTVTIPDKEQDKELKEKLKAEAGGILKWAIEGCVDYLQNGGLRPPASVMVATDEYFASEDNVANWIVDRCETLPTFRTRASELFASWRDWAIKMGTDVKGASWLKEELERLGFRHERIKTGARYVGIQVAQNTPSDESGNDDPGPDESYMRG
jgi:putative DNA primase/helicase